jgi:hypothetical protein
MKNHQSKLFWLGVLSGVGLLVDGKHMLASAFRLGLAAPTPEQCQEDYFLAEMVYVEALQRDELDYMAEFRRTETRDFSWQVTNTARGLAILGGAHILGGATIASSWLWLGYHVLQ